MRRGHGVLVHAPISGDHAAGEALIAVFFRGTALALQKK
jgi:hypothetical protein